MFPLRRPYYCQEPGHLDLQKFSSPSIRNKYFSWPGHFFSDLVISIINEPSCSHFPGIAFIQQQQEYMYIRLKIIDLHFAVKLTDQVQVVMCSPCFSQSCLNVHFVPPDLLKYAPKVHKTSCSFKILFVNIYFVVAFLLHSIKCSSFFLARNLKILLSPLLKYPVTRAQRQSLQNSLRLPPWQHNPRPH